MQSDLDTDITKADIAQKAYDNRSLLQTANNSMA